MKLSVNIKLVAPREIKQSNKHIDLREKVEQYIYDINSNFTESLQQWNYVKEVYRILSSRKDKLGEEEMEILKLVAPEVEKHGTGAELDSETMHRHLRDE